MGCGIALRLAQRRMRVLVLERSVPGAEASTVAAGILAPRIEHPELGPARSIGIAGLEAHSQLSLELYESHAIDVGFRRSGAMRLAIDGAELSELEASYGHEANARIGADEARRREPELSSEVLAGWDFPSEGQVEPPILLRALAIAAQHAGAEFRSGNAVRSVRIDAGRARGVITEHDSLEADHTVIAAGSWTSLVAGLPSSAGVVTPVRGQLISAELRPRIAQRVLFGAGGYIVPRPDGRVVCGATTEYVGFRKEQTVGGVLDVLQRATRLAPRLADASLRGEAVNFRPGSPDGLPLIGPAGPDGLWLATGHYRNGVLLGPITAQWIAEFVTGSSPSHHDLAAVDPRRFQ